MADKATAIIATRHERLAGDIKDKIASLADIQGVVKDFDPAYDFIKEKPPKLLFLDIREDVEPGFSLAGKVKRSLPETLIFVIAGSKDPDLILRSLKSGITDYIIFPFDKDFIVNQVKSALEKNRHKKREGELIVVSSNKGGQGVTTLAVNLTDHVHGLAGGKVLLVDLNLQTGDVAVFLDLADSYTPLNLIKDMERLDETLLFSSLSSHPKGFYVISAPEEIGEAGIIRSEDISRMFQTLKEYMDYIIVDMGQEFTERTAPAFDVADKILLLAQQTVPSIKSAKKMLKLFLDVGYREDKVKIIINRYEEKNLIEKKDIEDLIKQTIFAGVCNDYSPAIDAVNRGDLISKNHEDSRINRDIAALAGLITGIKKEEPGQKKNSVFKKLLPWVFKGA